VHTLEFAVYVPILMLQVEHLSLSCYCRIFLKALSASGERFIDYKRLRRALTGATIRTMVSQPH